MRGRWLKPEFFTDKKMGALGPICALVYQAIWVSADDSGMAMCDPELLKGQMFARWPDITVEGIQGALTELSLSARVKLYKGGDDIFAQVIRWKENQPINRPSKFTYRDDYSKRGKELREFAACWDVVTHGVLTEDSPSYTPIHLDTYTPTKDIVEFDNSTRHPLETIVERFGEVEARSNGTKQKEEAVKLATAIVFRYWMAKMSHPRAVLDKKRQTKIAARLRENNCDVDELLYVIDGAKRDDWTMGRDPKSTKPYDGIETIFRDRGQVEKFTDLAPHSDQRPHPLLRAENEKTDN